MARAVGVSRAAFARRFHELVGEPPITFVTTRRLALAADMLRDTGSTIGAVAARVGYGSPFALSTAFKRVYGISPLEHRRSARSAGVFLRSAHLTITLPDGRTMPLPARGPTTHNKAA